MNRFFFVLFSVILLTSASSFGQLKEDEDARKICSADEAQLKKDELRLRKPVSSVIGKLGTLQVTLIHQEITNLSEAEEKMDEDKKHENDVEEELTHCFSVDLTNGNSHARNLIYFETVDPNMMGGTRSVSMSLSKDGFILHLQAEDRYAEEGEEIRFFYHVDSKTLAVQKSKEDWTSDSDQDQKKISSLLKQGKCEAAVRAIAEMNKIPNAHDDRSTEFFETFADPFYQCIKKTYSNKNTEKMGDLAQKFFDGLDFQFSKPEYFYQIRRNMDRPSDEFLRRFNDLAFFIDMQKKPGDVPELMYEWILSKAPKRTLTLLNLGDHFEKVGNHEAALRTYAQYQKELIVLGKDPKKALKSTILKELETWKDPKPDREAKAYRLKKINGVDYRDYFAPPLVPGLYTQNGHAYRGQIIDSNPYFIQGIPAKNGNVFDSEGTLIETRLSQNITLNGITFQNRRDISRVDKNSSWSGNYVGPATVNGIKLIEDGFFCLGKNNELLQFTPVKGVSIRGYLTADGKPVVLQYQACHSEQSSQPSNMSMTLGGDVIVKGNPNRSIALGKNDSINVNWSSPTFPDADHLLNAVITLGFAKPTRIGKLLLLSSAYFSNYLLPASMNILGQNLIPSTGYLAEDFSDANGKLCKKGNYFGMDIGGNFVSCEGPGK